MDYLKLAPDIDTDPELEEAGWCAARVYELLLKVSALKDFRGRIPAEFLRPTWLARRWNLTAADLPGTTPEAFIVAGIERLVVVGKVRREGADLVIGGWEKFYRPAKSDAERQQEVRDRKRREDDEAPSRSVTVVRDGRDSHATPPTPPTPPTPLHTPPPNGGEAAAADGETEFLGWWNGERDRRGLGAEKKPEGLRRWLTEALDRADGDKGVLSAAAIGFLDDATVRAKDHPLRVFMRPGMYRNRIDAAPRGQVGKVRL